MTIITNQEPQKKTVFAGLDAHDAPSPTEKEEFLSGSAVIVLSQVKQRQNPDARIIVHEVSFAQERRLGEFVDTFQGIKTGDDACYVRFFWENAVNRPEWKFMQTTVDAHTIWGGASLLVWWKSDGRHLIRRREEGQAAARTRQAVSVSQMNNLPCCMLAAHAFDSNVSPLFVRENNQIEAIYTYCTSEEFLSNVRTLEPSLKANNGVLLKIPFDLNHWQKVAAEKYPDGLPEPYSDDPTQ